MTKISFDAERGEVEVTRNIKTGEGRVVINREGGGEIEINLGVGSAGLTTDYGGGISLGIGGQNVTWGREGGSIHIGIGGFDVDVEARDCIVTETKSIFGQIVAQRSYPDPGCKLPDPPRQQPDPPRPPSSNNPNGISTIKRCEGGRFELVGVAFASTEDRRYRIYPLEEALIQRDIVEETFSSRREFDGEAKANREFGVNKWYKVRRNRTEATGGGQWIWISNSNNSVFGSPGSISRNDATCQTNSEYDLYLPTPESPAQFYFFTSPGFNYKSMIISAISPPRCRVELPKSQLLPTGNKPPMRDCCEEILDYLADFEEAFDVQRLLKDKFPVSNTFMAPECDPASVTEAKSFYEIMQCGFRMMAHGMIFEPKVNIKDADAAKAGDQELKTKYLNATGWASAVAEALIEVKDDGNVSTNMDIRSGFASTQTMVGLADAIYRIDAILDCLGITLKPLVKDVETPYNLQIQIGKGFGSDNSRQIDLNTDEATEKLLSSFLQTKKNQIKTVEIHPRSETILEVLEDIRSSLSAGNNG